MAQLSTTREGPAAAAKSLQSCPTLCDPIDGSPTGSPIPGILQTRTLEWVAISFSFGIVNKAEVDVFVELSCFFNDPTDVGNLISGSSVFSKTSLNIWKFIVHILLKPGLKDFEDYLASMGNECNCTTV